MPLQLISGGWIMWSVLAQKQDCLIVTMSFKLLAQTQQLECDVNRVSYIYKILASLIFAFAHALVYSTLTHSCASLCVYHAQYACIYFLRVVYTSLRVCTSVLTFLTLGTHAQRGLQYLVCLSVRPSICPSVTTFFATTRNEVAKKRYKPVQCYTGLIFKMAIFQKRLRSGDMA